MPQNGTPLPEPYVIGNQMDSTALNMADAQRLLASGYYPVRCQDGYVLICIGRIDAKAYWVDARKVAGIEGRTANPNVRKHAAAFEAIALAFRAALGFTDDAAPAPAPAQPAPVQRIREFVPPPGALDQPAIAPRRIGLPAYTQQGTRPRGA